MTLDPKNPTTATLTATVDPASLELTAPPKGFVAELTARIGSMRRNFPRSNS